MDFTDTDDRKNTSTAASLNSASYGRNFEQDLGNSMPTIIASAYEPAFIETDFTSPLTRTDRDRNVVSAPPSSVPICSFQIPVTNGPGRPMTSRSDHNLFASELSVTENPCPSKQFNSITAVKDYSLHQNTASLITDPQLSHENNSKNMQNILLTRSNKVFQFSQLKNFHSETTRLSTQDRAVPVSFSNTDVSVSVPETSQRFLQPVLSVVSCDSKKLVATGPCQDLSVRTFQPAVFQLKSQTMLKSGTMSHFQTIYRKSPAGSALKSMLGNSSSARRTVALSALHNPHSAAILANDNIVQRTVKLPVFHDPQPVILPVQSTNRPMVKLESHLTHSAPSLTQLSIPKIQAAANTRNASVFQHNESTRKPDVLTLNTRNASVFQHKESTRKPDVLPYLDSNSLANVDKKFKATGGHKGKWSCSTDFDQVLDCSTKAGTQTAISLLPHEHTYDMQHEVKIEKTEELISDIGKTCHVVSISSQHKNQIVDVPPERTVEEVPGDFGSSSADGNSARTCMSALSLTAEGEFEEEREFVWNDYLEETKAPAAAATSFKHVEYSLKSGFEKGMKLEIANKTPEGTYWVSSIIMTCGQLLRMRPEGCQDDGSMDFWWDLKSADVHQLGWCKEYGKRLCPSEELSQKFPCVDWKSVLEASLSAKTPPLYMLDKRTGPLPIDQIKEGMFLEVQLVLQPDQVWPVRVIENVGGHLLLRYEALETASDDFWLFYLHHRLHPIGWSKAKNCQYHPPDIVLIKRTDFDWAKHLDENLELFRENQPPIEIFEDQNEIKKHKFVEGWKLEAVHPGTLSFIYPASVKHVINEFYFTVELILQENQDPVQFCCHSGSLSIFPVGWCFANGIDLGEKDFDWASYLKEHSAEQCPKELFNLIVDDELLGFEPGMKLEAINPKRPGQICVATIKRVIDGVMWIHLDHDLPSVPDYIFSLDTFDVFPIGWCESNNYPLKVPKVISSRRFVSVQSERHLEDEARSALYMQMKEADLKKSSGWCPKIYFNYRCFTGRYLSKGRLVLLPRSVGPGSVVLVMTTVLSKLISVAYKSSRVLREIQLKGKPNPNMHQQLLRAKYKGKSYSAIVEICTSSDQIVNFCHEVCRRLECCPNLISPHSYNSVCPDNCSRLAKGKHNYYFGHKKRKIGRPPGGHSNLEFGAKKPGKRRRHRKLLLTLRKKHGLVGRLSSPGDEDEAESNSTGSWKCLMENDEESRDSRESAPRVSRKRKEPSTTDIQTRGVKLPKYSFERKTHKKVLHTTQRQDNNARIDFMSSQPLKNEEVLKLSSNPLYWSVQEVVDYIKTTDCASIARLFKEQEIDGQSLLLLSLPTVQEHLEPKLGPAVKLCHQIERLKLTFYQQFA